MARIHNIAFREWIESLGHVYDYHYITPSEVLRDFEKGNEEDTLWIAEIDGEAIGYTHCHYQLERGDRDIPTLYFYPTSWSMGQSKIAIIPEYRKLGYSIELIARALEHYEDMRTEVAIVQSYSDNKAATKLLKRMGFIHKEEFCYEPYSDEIPLVHDSIFAHRDLQGPLPKIKLNSEVIVRNAEEGDVDDILDIHRQNVWWSLEAQDSEWAVDYVTGEFGHTLLVAEYHNSVVGVMDFIAEKHRVGISGVLPKYQRKGIGTTLFYWLLVEMQKQKVPEAIADTGVIQEAAIRMYEKFGFRIPRKQYMWVKQLNVIEL